MSRCMKELQGIAVEACKASTRVSLGQAPNGIPSSATFDSSPRSPNAAVSTRAGAVLHLTQSALSHQLLGTSRTLPGPRLFHRLGRNTIPTPAGWTGCSPPRPRSSPSSAPPKKRFARAWKRPLSRLLPMTSQRSRSTDWLPPVLKNLARAPSATSSCVFDVDVTETCLHLAARGQSHFCDHDMLVRNRHLGRTTCSRTS